MRRPGLQSGFLLAEYVVGLGVMSVLSAIVVSSVFQLQRASDIGRSRQEVIVEVRKSTLWLTRDIRRASATSLSDGGGPSGSASFNWVDSGGTARSCIYELNNGDLQRTCDGVAFISAGMISGLSFTRSGRLVTAAYTITSASDPTRTETVTLRVAMRVL